MIRGIVRISAHWRIRSMGTLHPKVRYRLQLRDLWIGSEGTLGVVTGITLRLILSVPSRITFLAAFSNDESALTAPPALSFGSSSINSRIYGSVDN